MYIRNMTMHTSHYSMSMHEGYSMSMHEGYSMKVTWFILEKYE